MHAIFKDFLHLCEFHIKLTINRTSTKREITVIGSLTPKYCPFFASKEPHLPTHQPTHCWAQLAVIQKLLDTPKTLESAIHQVNHYPVDKY